jgi:hypothetical protein
MAFREPQIIENGKFIRGRQLFIRIFCCLSGLNVGKMSHLPFDVELPRVLLHLGHAFLRFSVDHNGV